MSRPVNTELQQAKIMVAKAQLETIKARVDAKKSELDKIMESYNKKVEQLKEMGFVVNNQDEV